jgi:hypothetical protein
MLAPHGHDLDPTESQEILRQLAKYRKGERVQNREQHRYFSGLVSPGKLREAIAWYSASRARSTSRLLSSRCVPLPKTPRVVSPRGAATSAGSQGHPEALCPGSLFTARLLVRA